jgi:hypothetical protein
MEDNMFISIRKYDGTGNVNEIDSLAKSDLIPVLKSQPGFISYSILDLGSEAVASISIFETREQADGANASARNMVQKVFKELLPTPPTIIMGEVVSHTGK